MFPNNPVDQRHLIYSVLSISYSNYVFKNDLRLVPTNGNGDDDNIDACIAFDNDHWTLDTQQRTSVGLGTRNIQWKMQESHVIILCVRRGKCCMLHGAQVRPCDILSTPLACTPLPLRPFLALSSVRSFSQQSGIRCPFATRSLVLVTVVGTLKSKPCQQLASHTATLYCFVAQLIKNLWHSFVVWRVDVVVSSPVVFGSRCRLSDRTTRSTYFAIGIKHCIRSIQWRNYSTSTIWTGRHKNEFSNRQRE